MKLSQVKVTIAGGQRKRRTGLPKPDVPVLVSTFLMTEGELGSKYEAKSAATALAPGPLG